MGGKSERCLRRRRGQQGVTARQLDESSIRVMHAREGHGRGENSGTVAMQQPRSCSRALHPASPLHLALPSS